jgi:hypothetical protein
MKSIFEEDVVVLVADPSKIGVVTKVGKNSDSDDEYTDSEDEEEIDVRNLYFIMNC